MTDSIARKRFNRSVKRKVEDGRLSEQEAQPLFRRGPTAKSPSDPIDVIDIESPEQEETIEPAPWHYKGEGKGGSLCLSVGSLSVLGKAHIPDAPLANTEETVQDMFDQCYFRFPDTPFWDGKNIWQVKRGTHCLWKNVPVGKRGGESTKVELFHGEVHGWDGDDCIIS